MTTKIRPLTILLAITILFCLGTMIFVAIKNLVSNIQIFPYSLTIFLVILFFSGVFCVIYFTLVIRNDLNKRIITFYYPFRFVRKTYHYSEIIGFRFKYLPSQFINYKAIQIKTNDGKLYIISDFETSNLREIEKIAIENFKLARDKSFIILDQSRKEEELLKSHYFDISQFKSLRVFYIMTVIACGILLFYMTYSLTEVSGPPANHKVVLLVLICICFFGAFFKIVRSHKNKNGL